MPASTFRLHPRSYVVPVLGLSGVIIALGALVVTGVAHSAQGPAPYGMQPYST